MKTLEYYLRNVNFKALSFLLCFLIAIYSNEKAISTTNLRLVNTTINLETVLVPDWENISFANFPAINSEGTIDLTGESRNWKKGQTPDQFLKLEDINSSLFPNLLNLNNIMEATQDFSLINTSLSKFPLVTVQSLDYLSTIVPGLGKTKVKNIPPIQELLKSVLKENTTDVENLPLERVIAISPNIGTLALNTIDLSNYPIALIKNLEFVELGKFKNWEKAYINQIPGLNKLPLGKYPVPLSLQGEVTAKIKFLWGKQKSSPKEAISGSYKVGFQYNCDESCSNIELTAIKSKAERRKENAAWIEGEQKVAGGNGCLAKVNNGEEPTGRHPFGSLFKVVVDKIDDTEDVIHTALYFRFINWCGATPYVVGPIAFQDYGVDSIIFLGDDKREDYIKEEKKATESLSAVDSLATNALYSIDVKILAKAIANFNGSTYAYKSDFIKNTQGQKGRLLGLYLFPSYALTVVEAVKSQPGGTQWLKDIESGQEINTIDLNKYLAPAIQDNLFSDYLTSLIQTTSQEIDPNTGKFFSETNLLSRVVSKVFFGEASLVNQEKPDRVALVKNFVNLYNNQIK